MREKTKKIPVPKGWKRARLGDFCAFENGTKVGEGKPNYLEIGDIDVSRKAYQIEGKDKLTVAGAVQVPRGTLLISKVRPTRGAVVVTRDEINVSPAFSRLRIPNKYFYYVASQDKFLAYLGAQAKGSTYPTCKDEDVLGYEFVYPADRKEQEKIAEILESVDEEIAKTDEIIAATEKLKKGLMQELFTHGIGHTKFKKTPIGVIPSSWSLEPLENSGIEIIDGDRGDGYPKKSDFSEVGHCLFLSAKNIKDDRFVFDERSFVTEEKDAVLRKGKLKRCDVILTTRGTVGNVAYYGESIPFENIRINSGMLIFRASKDFNPAFVYQLMKSFILKKRYAEMVSGSAQPQLPIRSLAKILVIRPPLAEQEMITNVLVAVDESLSRDKALLDQLDSLKNGLMQDLLSGKVRIAKP